MKHTSINDENINILMDIFYDKIREDEHLGEIFDNAIGTSDEEWVAHKAKIGDFWKGMLLGTGIYAGNPMQKHFDLPPFPKEFFSIWLGLFEDSLDEIYDETNKNLILQRAKMIANRFMSMLYNA